MALELRHLELVRAVAEEGSLSRAALRLHVTPSALSHQLRDAEERLDVKLFDRVGRRLRLSAAGERLLV
jgi:LysR family transcriptional regulator for metE and metH